jgi:hypothetical protein
MLILSYTPFNQSNKHILSLRGVILLVSAFDTTASIKEVARHLVGQQIPAE